LHNADGSKSDYTHESKEFGSHKQKHFAPQTPDGRSEIEI